MQVIKVLTVFLVMIYAQMILMYLVAPDSVEKNNKSGTFHAKRTVMYFEVLHFYFVLFSMIFFTLITRVFPFKTLRERQGYGLNMKNKQDFLFYVREDIPYFNMVFAQLSLYLYLNLQDSNK